jgi:hypothetical protein
MSALVPPRSPHLAIDSRVDLRSLPAGSVVVRVVTLQAAAPEGPGAQAPHLTSRSPARHIPAQLELDDGSSASSNRRRPVMKALLTACAAIACAASQVTWLEDPSSDRAAIAAHAVPSVTGGARAGALATSAQGASALAAPALRRGIKS